MNSRQMSGPNKDTGVKPDDGCWSLNAFSKCTASPAAAAQALVPTL